MAAGRRALLVGVSQYSDARIGNLNYADRDAQSLYDFLRSPLGGEFKHDEIRLLVNEYATLESLRTSIATFASDAREDDPVLFFLCGHGMAEQLRPRNVYFLTHDSRVDALYGTAFPMWELWASVERFVRSQKITVFIDCCRAGAFGVDASVRDGASSDTLTARALQEYWEQVGKAAAGVSIMTATDSDTNGYEHSKWGGGHGVFTHCLLEALGGKAELLDSRFVTAKRAFDYVFDQVRKETGNRQRPWASAHLDDTLPLSTVPISSPATSAFKDFDPANNGESRYELHFQAAYRFATDAERSADPIRAEALWEKAQREASLALSYRDTDEGRNVLAEARHQLAVRNAGRLTAAGQLRQAKDAYESALQYRDEQAVREQLSLVDRRIQTEELLIEAKNREGLGDFSGALSTLTRLRELGGVAGIDEMIQTVVLKQEKERIRREAERILTEIRSASSGADWSRVVALSESAQTLEIGDEVEPMLKEALFQLALHQRREAEKAASRRVWPESLRYFELAVAHLLQLQGLGRSEYQQMGHCYEGMAKAHKQLGDSAKAYAFLSDAVAAKEKAIDCGQGDQQSLGTTMHDTGQLCLDNPQVGDAIHWFKRAIEVKQAAIDSGKGNPLSLAASQHSLGHAYMIAKDYEQGYTWLNKAIALKEAALAAGQDVGASLAVSQFQVGRLLVLKSKYSEAIPWFAKAQETEAPLVESGGVTRRSHAITCLWLGATYSNSYDHKRGLEWCQKATTLDEQAVALRDSDAGEYYVSVDLDWQTTCYEGMRDLAMAVRTQEQRVAILKRLKHADLKSAQTRLSRLRKKLQSVTVET